MLNCLLFAHQDLSFILKGVTRLLNNPLIQTYLPHSTKKIHFHQELLILFWKICDFNKVETGKCTHTCIFIYMYVYIYVDALLLHNIESITIIYSIF